MDIQPVHRALISVSDKTGLADFAKSLSSLGVEIISTGGTSAFLQEHHIEHRQVESITGLPSILDGRVKTLHPKIHGAILGRRDIHSAEAKELNIEWIDLVIVNFYPFSQAVAENDLNWDQAIEYIDIGGPTMVRAAAKNSAWVGVVMDPADYAQVLAQLQTQGGLSKPLRQSLAYKVFVHTAAYDAAIANYMAKKLTASKNLQLNYEKFSELRYGENPHQKAFAYKDALTNTGILSAEQKQGKALSYNNILDSEAAVNCVNEFATPACVIVKHANPCGVATASQIEEAFDKALQADSKSAFGGIIALNRTCTQEIAAKLTAIFMEVIIAPSYTEEALRLFASKPNLRLLQLTNFSAANWEFKGINGGMLMQECDHQVIHAKDLQVVTKKIPSSRDIENMLFACRVVKHIKSNAILLAKDNVTVGIGAGQVSRIDAVELAIRKAGKNIGGCVLASDAFFPFRDSIDGLAHTGLSAIIQPGGSLRDAEVIAACDELGIAMVFTGKRCFKH